MDRERGKGVAANEVVFRENARETGLRPAASGKDDSVATTLRAAPPSRRGREAQKVLNQLLARRVNEQIDRFSHDSVFDDYVCECGSDSCVGPLSLTHEEYDEIRRQPGRLVVRPGHWSPTHDRVVRDRPRYQVIEKVGEAATEMQRLHAVHDRALAGGSLAGARRQ